MGTALDTDGAADLATTRSAVPPAAQEHRTLFGFEHRNGIDAKSRVVLPAPYRPGFADGGYLTFMDGRCLGAFPRDEFARWVSHLRAGLAAANEADPADVIREAYRNTVEIKLDVQGRMVVPEPLRTLVGIGDEVRFVGCGRRVELWPAEEGEERVEERADHRSTIAMLASSFDLSGIEA